jgi:hypothetical protein
MTKIEQNNFKVFPLVSFTVYRVRRAVVGGNFASIGEYSRIDQIG